MKKKILITLSLSAILATSAIAGFKSNSTKNYTSTPSPTIKSNPGSGGYIPTPKPKSGSGGYIPTSRPNPGSGGYIPTPPSQFSDLQASIGENGYDTGENSGKDGLQNWTYGEGENSATFRISSATSSPTPTPTATPTAAPTAAPTATPGANPGNWSIGYFPGGFRKKGSLVSGITGRVGTLAPSINTRYMKTTKFVWVVDYQTDVSPYTKTTELRYTSPLVTVADPAYYSGNAMPKALSSSGGKTLDLPFNKSGTYTVYVDVYWTQGGSTAQRVSRKFWRFHVYP